ncbi:hypothetical protein BDV39DRAFT_165775 [Aspergillus sergii]|uniref:Uncharacterized protein n=1 Tax=Aspergillus sergii TaxID=1034303 RepID=A0A5N6XM73_9EURO|nr:hypothetical protein BDV39DRAFT_165775 [Aspergillus sergii]
MYKFSALVVLDIMGFLPLTISAIKLKGKRSMLIFLIVCSLIFRGMCAANGGL